MRDFYPTEVRFTDFGKSTTNKEYKKKRPFHAHDHSVRGDGRYSLCRGGGVPVPVVGPPGEKITLGKSPTA